MKISGISLLLLLNLLLLKNFVMARQSSSIVHDQAMKTLTLSDSSKNLVLRLNYAKGCVLDKVVVQGNEVLGNGNTVYSGVRSGDQLFSSTASATPTVLAIHRNVVTIRQIKFGDEAFSVEEEWVFKVNKHDIDWQIHRKYLNNGVIDQNYFPSWQFNTIKTWDGAMLDNGGVAWNRFLNEPGETYGAHAAALTFWNRSNNSCLRITPVDDHKTFRATAFSHQKNGVFSVVQVSSAKEINTKHGLRRFLQAGQDIFAPDTVSRSSVNIHIKLQALTYTREYDRGVLKGISSSSVNEMFNTIGRYGVVDKNLYGSNGWRTGWAVLQEPWLALFGLAINAPDFINGYSETLAYERDHAIMPDGRVLPRWHHDSSDAMPNTFRPDGFYECQWGYMFDSQPAYAIDVAEQFDLTGDTGWLRQFKPACEKVLDFMIKRDTDGNGLFEVAQSSYREEKGADWMDVVWASYEVASINAYMYKALARWSELEKLLGDEKTSAKYQELALKLRTTFNKNTSDGGFWNPDKKWFAYWREKDGSVYGNNFVSMVNFLAIGYGICGDEARKDAILENMEVLMQKEQLFIWPSCFYPYEDNVGLKKVNYPYPNYENGDLFLAWAELGTRCYAEKRPEVALKYIRNIIDQYEKDGLAHQRYTRLKQTGAGDDILSNNIMAVVGLYRNIYGIRPQYNRLYLEPHLTTELDGTHFKYWLRNQQYEIGLAKNKYSISTGNFSVSNRQPFAVNYNGSTLEYFNGNSVHRSLEIQGSQPCAVEILDWKEDLISWKETGKNATGNIPHVLHNLKANETYQLVINNEAIKEYVVNAAGTLRFDCRVNISGSVIRLVRK